MTSWELFQSFKILYYLDSINPFTQKKKKNYYYEIWQKFDFHLC